MATHVSRIADEDGREGSTHDGKDDQQLAKPPPTEASALLGAGVSPRGRFSFAYRSDIDGLRAVAVVAVIVYHSDPHWLPGGFLGVDVFFVISGYVVTGSLLSSATDQPGPHLGFGAYLSRFYARRLKRLTPALVLCVVGTTLLLLLLLGVAYSEPALQDCYSAAQLALIGASNLQFALARESYWADQGLTAQATNPLLHTWSLGVEEQFYLLFPAALTAVPRYIGRISYNLYLWHWPAIVLGKFLARNGDASPLRHLGNPTAAVLATLVSLVVGVCVPVISFRVVESPVRAWRPAKPVHAIAAMLALIGVAEVALVVARGPAGKALQMWAAARIMGGSWVDVMAAMAFTGSHGANPDDGALRFGRTPGGGSQPCACQMAAGSAPPDHFGLATTATSAPFCTADVGGSWTQVAMQLSGGGTSPCFFAVGGTTGSAEVTQCLTPDRSDTGGLPSRALFVIGDSHSNMLLPALALAARGAYQVHNLAVAGCGVMEAGFSDVCHPHPEQHPDAEAHPEAVAHRKEMADAMYRRLGEVVEAGDLVVVVEMNNHWATDLISHDTPAGSFSRLRDALPEGARILLIGDAGLCEPADAPNAAHSSTTRKDGADTMRSLANSGSSRPTYFFDAYDALSHTWDACKSLPNTSTSMWKEIGRGKVDGHLSLAGMIYMWGPICKAMHENGLLDESTYAT